MIACPTDERLRGFLADDGNPDSDGSLGVHVSECRACQDRLEAFAGGEDVEQWQRIWDGTPETGDSETPEIVSKVKAVLPAVLAIGEDSAGIALGAPTVAETAQRIARLLEQSGRFSNVMHIGSGGFGIVFRARGIHPDVAVKVLRPDRATSAEERARFAQEARNAASVRHDNVVTIHDVAVTPGSPELPLIVMDFVPGESLRDRLQREGALEFRTSAEIARQAALGLHAAHEQGLVHRDVKPSNLLLEKSSGRVKVSDFGLAVAGETATGQAVRAEGLGGTPQYMSPEQVKTPTRVDRRTDIYSLGIVLFEMLTGERPFRGSGRALLAQIAHEAAPTPRRLNPSIPLDLDTIVQRCMARVPSMRYATAEEVAEDLRRYLSREPIRARRVSSLEKTWLWSRRRPWQAASVALSAVLAVLMLIFGVASGMAARKEAAIRASAEKDRDEVKRLLYKTEVLQAKFQLQSASLSLDAGQYVSASNSLYDVPSSIESWDVRWLRAKSRPPLELRAPLVDGDWWIVDGALSPDGKFAAVVDAGGLVSIWNLNSGRLVASLGMGRRSSEILRWANHFEARAANTSWKQLGPCATSVAWLGDAKTVVLASLDGSLRLWRIGEKRPGTKKQLDQPLFCVAVSGDAKRILAGGSQGGVFLLEPDVDIVRTDLENRASVRAIVAIPGDGWLVGRETGAIERYRGEDLSHEHVYETKGPVWSLDARPDDGGPVVAIAGGEPQIEVCRLPGDPAECALIGVFGDPRQAEAVAYQEVRFAADGRRLYAGDARGRLVCWDMDTGRREWETTVASPGPLRNELRKYVRDLGLGDDFPIPFQRSVGFVGERPDELQLVTGGEDTTLKLWQARHVSSGSRRTLSSGVGPSPVVLFDSLTHDRLWGLSSEGKLRVLNLGADRVLDEVRAHPGGTVSLAAFDESGTVVSAGGDRVLRCWRFTGGKATEQNRDKYRHDTGLLSVAVSPGRRWIASVDVLGRLVVWNYASGRVDNLAHLNDALAATPDDPLVRPVSGRVAFNLDGSRLAAFGSYQSAPVFETAPFRRLSDQILIAGDGGTALVWSPQYADTVYAADNHPRCTARVFATGPKESEQIVRPESICVEMLNTPDGRRLVTVEQNGRMVFMESRTLVQMTEMRSGLKDVASAAISPTGGSLAIADKQGHVEIWNAGEAGADKPTVPQDELDAWKATWLVKPSPNILRTDHRMVRIDNKGGLGLLYTESTKASFRTDGALYYLLERGRVETREMLKATNPEYNQRATAEAAGLWYDSKNRPWAAIRRRTAKVTAYDGDVHVAHREGKDDWRSLRVHEAGNLGFYPYLRLQDDRPKELLHFSFAGFYLVSSRPGAAEDGKWSLNYLGRQGDGMQLSAAEDATGVLHMVFHPNRSNCDVARNVYARWDGDEFVREVIDPFLDISPLQVALAPDGSPTVILGRHVMHKVDGQWREYGRLPISPSSPFVVDSQGNVSFVTWDSAQNQLLLWRGRGNDWSTVAIADSFPEGAPNWWSIRLDANDRPIIVLGTLGEPYGWLRALRPSD